MHPVLMEGTKFFRHNPGSSCPFAAAESVEHLHLKGRIANTVDRIPRWRSELEARGRDPKTGEEYIVDVAALHDDSRRPPWTYEVQLSPQGEEETRRRTEQRERGHRAQVVWLNPRQRPWGRDFPSVVLDKTHSQIVDGVFDDEDVRAAPMPVESLVEGFHRNRYQWVNNYGFINRLTYRGFATPAAARHSRRGSGTVADACDKLGTEGSGSARLAAAPPAAPFWADWSDDNYFAYARQSHARRAAGVELSLLDEQVLSMYPDLPSMFDPLPSMLEPSY